MKTCIIVPMYNEQNFARLSVTTILSYASQLPDTFTVLVVNDGSKDKTEAILQGLLSEYSGDRYRIITHPVNKGYGAALKTGINFAIDNNYDYVVFMDSDLTNHPKYLKDFYTKMVESYDYIKASRYIKGGGTKDVPLMRVIISCIGNILAKFITQLPLTDFTNGFRTVKTAILSKIEFTENGFAIIMEELYLSKPLVRSYAEIPYVLTGRTEEQGKTHFTYDIKTYFTYLKYAIKSVGKRRPVV